MNLSVIKILILALCSCAISAHAEVFKVNGQEVTIGLNGKKVSIGELLDVVDTSGAKKGVIKITEIEKSSAVAELQSGFAAVGMKVSRSRRVSVERKYQSDYAYNFRVNPIGLIAGSVAANFDFKIFENWTIGPQGAYLKLNLAPTGMFTSNYKITAWGIGARANWFFKGALKNGFYLGPSLEYLAVNVQTTDAFGPASGDAAGMMASCLLGYAWFARGLNFMLGAGYGTVLGASGITIKDSIGNKQTIVANLSGLTYELSIGYAF